MSNYPNIQAVIDGTVSGHATEWPQLRLELIQLRKENEKLLWAKEEQLQALADVVNAAASETNALNRARLILAKNRGEVDQ